jgi:Mn-dependent DtxR family transcriptional regulator
LNYINSGKGSFEALAESLSIDDNTLTLWLQTLVGAGYLEKEKPDGYRLTQKGLAKLRRHRNF